MKLSHSSRLLLTDERETFFFIIVDFSPFYSDGFRMMRVRHTVKFVDMKVEIDISLVDQKGR